MEKAGRRSSFNGTCEQAATEAGCGWNIPSGADAACSGGDPTTAYCNRSSGGGGSATECSAGWGCCEYGKQADYSVVCDDTGSQWDCECTKNGAVVGSFTGFDISTDQTCDRAAAESGCGWEIP